MAAGDTRKVLLENTDGEYLIPYTEVASSNTVGRVKPDGTSTVVDANGVISVTGKQDTLVSGTNIKTINSTSLLGSGDIAVQAVISDLSTIRSGAEAGATAVQPADLATVATSGAYSDLSGTPTIPTVNNATLTIQKNGTTVNTFTANASSNVTANITVPTKTSDLTNDDGFITGITSSDVTTALGYTPYNSSNPSGYQANVIETVKVNGTALTPSSKAVDVTVPTETTVSGWGFTKNTGTVTSVNNVSPVSGNVTLSIPTVNNATLTITQGGTTKGTFTANASSNVTIDLDSGGSTAVDNKSITTNSSSQLQAIGVINARDSSTAVKTWTGTKQQYDGITTKDANTLYNITDDTDVSLTILEALYPVGSIYETTNATCPLSSLISGSTWVEETSRVLVDKYQSGTNWWELYSDGWCEQGGQFVNNDSTFSVNLLKTMSNTNYSVFVTLGENNKSGSFSINVGSRTTTGFTGAMSSSTTTYKSCWRACGYTSTTTNHKRFRRTV